MNEDLNLSMFLNMPNIVTKRERHYLDKYFHRMADRSRTPDMYN